MLKNTIDKQKNKKLISLLIIILLVIILLIAFITLENKTQLIAKVQETIKAQKESTMKEKLEIAIAELKQEKQGKESLDDITQSWLNEKLAEYECTLINDILASGKKVIIKQNDIITKFYIDEDLNVQEVESGIYEFSYENKEIDGEKVQLLIRIQDKEKSLRKIQLPNGNQIECFGKTEYGIDYNVKFGEENKIKMISQNGAEQEETILIENYYHNITKKLAKGISIDNKAIKAANNQPYTAKITADENYTIGKIKVKMGETEIPVDLTTGEINIQNVTDDIEITALTNIEISYSTEVAVTVDLEINYPEISSLKTRKEYSLDGETYNQYKGTITITKNGTLIARLVNAETNEVLIETQEKITNIGGYEWEVWDVKSQTTYATQQKYVTNVFTAKKNGNESFYVYSSYTETATAYSVGGSRVKINAYYPTSCYGGFVSYQNGIVQITNHTATNNGSLSVFNGNYYYKEPTTTYSKGDTQHDNVISGNENDYPANGKQGEYWYIRVK